MFQVSIRKENGATIVSDQGAIAELLAIGKRPIERVVWGNDFAKIGEAVSDIESFFTAITLQVAEKSGKVERVGVPAAVAAGLAGDPGTPTREAAGIPTSIPPKNRVAAHVNGNGNGNGHAPPPAPVKPEVAAELEAFIALDARALWRLRHAGFKSLDEVRAWARDKGTDSRHLGNRVRSVTVASLKKWDKAKAKKKG